MQFFKASVGVLFVLTLFACAVNPVTGKKEFTLMSSSQEVAVGEQSYHTYQQQQGGRYVVDPELNIYVNKVGQKLARVSDRPELPYDFVVINNSIPNAWALPGGKIAINRGLLDLLDDEAQLAAVLSHEIVHAAARHTAKQMTQATLLNVGMIAAGVASQNTDYGEWIAVGAGLGASAWQARYGREQELEADSYGVRYMVEAGYDAQGAVELQQKFVALSEGRSAGFMENLFASHPPSQERVKRNQQLAQEFANGARNQQAFARAMQQVRKDKEAYDAHVEALALAQKSEFAKALGLIDKAISRQPQEALFHVAKGQLQMAEKKNTDALKAFQRARQLNPEYYAGHLGAGLLYVQANNNSQATSALEASMNLLATPIASYHLGELALASGDTSKARSYFEFAAQGTGEIAEAAKGQLAKLPQ